MLETSESPLDSRRSNQSILREINPEYLLERLMLKLKLQYSGHQRWTAHSLEKSLMLGKIAGQRIRGYQRMRRLDGITDAMDMNLDKLGRWWRTERPGVLQSMGSQRVRHNWATEQQHTYPWWLRGEESTCNAGDTGLIPRSGRSPGEGNGQRSRSGYSPWGCKELDMI